jgi:hypothetical protein
MTEAWRQNNLELRRQQMKDRRSIDLAKFRNWKSERGCKFCSETESVCLDLHHLDPPQKDYTVSDIIGVQSWTRLMEEVAKCIVVCKNCHTKIHANVIKL